MSAAAATESGLAGMLLAAGHGTRLRPLTDQLPKPLVPVGDRSVAAIISQHLATAGYQRLVANVHHLPERWDRQALAALALPTTLVHEAEILGTAGGVAHAAAALGPGEVLVHGGDILVELDVGALRAFHARHDAFATLAVVGGRPVGEGTVGFDGRGRVVRLRTGRFGQEVSGGDFVGVQLLSAEARAELPRTGCLVGDVYLPALERGRAVMARAVANRFTDIGSPRAYLQANLAWLRARALPSYVGPDANVDDAVTLDEAVIGAGARVRGCGVIARCVVWPGVEVEAPLSDAIVTPTTTVYSA